MMNWLKMWFCKSERKRRVSRFDWDHKMIKYGGVVSICEDTTCEGIGCGCDDAGYYQFVCRWNEKKMEYDEELINI
jgi:hypothetical protein